MATLQLPLLRASANALSSGVCDAGHTSAPESHPGPSSSEPHDWVSGNAHQRLLFRMR